jgi:hypothetical protein
MDFKTDYAKERYELLHPAVKELLIIADKWSLERRKKPLVLTETVTDAKKDKAEGRESPSHREGRAVDIRVKDWTEKEISAFVAFLNEKYLYLGYIRKKTGKRILAYLHGEGDDRHVHLAIGIDVAEKYKKSYPNWKSPLTIKTNKSSQEKEK